MSEKQTCWVLTGPTACGKTALSIRIAKAFECEIICMDSMQVYRGMDIGTAKPDSAEQDGVPHHLLDVADPSEPFSVTMYCNLAEKAAREILARGRRPLFVGGTGFYLRALRHPMGMGGTAADPGLRARFAAQAEGEGGRERLWALLREKDPRTAERLHPNDVRRVIRALEVTEVTGRPFSEQDDSGAEAAFDYRVAVLEMDREIMYDRINRRVTAMLDAGLADEVRRLLSSGVPEDAQAMKGIGYKELIPYLHGKCTLEEAADSIRLGTRHYAKRQATWMRREENVFRQDPLAPDAYEKLTDFFTEREHH